MMDLTKLFSLKDLEKMITFKKFIKKTKIKNMNPYAINRKLINFLVTDLIENTQLNIKK